MGDIELPEARVLRLQPGDIVVLTADQVLSQAQAQQIRERAEPRFAPHQVVVLSGLDISVVRGGTDG